ncbi:VQ motif-containing protein 10-like [Heracleum sosnowskyi]|uniref:VQ motif-containing protein 10-like n=1 Tax=Heracleum sosnowskyi TaxID=360622 RepID=A0AAD8N970_9APIA|nr:VQ motif-containing protein 10-like [Heracleum sosnowskyi]
MSAADQRGGNGRVPPVRVVIISTQYIETDPANFKSVVQRLTGKHSHPIHSNHELPLPPKRRRLSPPPSVSEVAASTAGVMVGSSSSNNTNSSSLSVMTLSRGVSVSDFDRLQTLPSWKEIFQLCM